MRHTFKLFLLTAMLWVAGAISVSAEDYGFWVGSVKVKSGNCSNITGGNIKSGSVKYDPDKKILTLTDVTIYATGSGGDCIHNQSCDGLKVEFYGTNNLTAKDIEALNCEKDTYFHVMSGETSIQGMKENKPTVVLDRIYCSFTTHNGAELYIGADQAAAIKGVNDSETSYYGSTLMFFGNNITIDGARGALVDIITVGFRINEYDTYPRSGIRLDYTGNSSYPIVQNVRNMSGTNYTHAPQYPQLPNSVIVSPKWSVFDDSKKTICDKDGNPIYATPIDISNYINNDQIIAVVNENNFPDVNFRNIVSKKFDLFITQSKIDSFKELDVSMKEISSLDGINIFRNLEKVNCSLNKLTQFDYYLPRMKRLECVYNQITYLNTTNWPSLTELECAYNKIESLEFLYPRLVYLHCSDNKLKEIKGLDLQKETLEYLYCDNNSFTEFDVTGFSQLKDFSCSQNQLLEKLTCVANLKLKSLSFNVLPNLKELDCRANYGLTSVYLSCENLKKLNLNFNALTGIDLQYVPRITELRIDENPIGSLNLKKNTSLETLFCRSCGLNELDISDLQYLSTFSCKDNNISSLSLPANSYMKLIECRENNLSSLDLSNCGILEGVDCSVNNITSLILPNNLQTLDKVLCYRNKLGASAMDAIVSALRDRMNMTSGKFYVCYNGTDAVEGNVCTAAHVKEALDKNWTVLYNDGTPYDGMIRLRGDIDGNGEVNTVDVTILYNVMFGTDTTTDKTICDLDGSGDVNTGDVTVLYNIIFGTAK